MPKRFADNQRDLYMLHTLQCKGALSFHTVLMGTKLLLAMSSGGVPLGVNGLECIACAAHQILTV